MMRSRIRTLALAALLPLAGCIDFLDPVGLKLAKPTRIDIDLELQRGPLPPACRERGEAPRVPVGPIEEPAYFCVEASVFPGVDKFGAPKEVTNDTLWVLGVPLLPELDGETLRYGYRFTLPTDELAQTVFSVVYPQVGGVSLAPNGVRWRAVEPLQPDSLVRARGEDLVLRLELPDDPGNPLPRRWDWVLNLAGTNTTASVRASGSIPRPRYLFPAALLADLGDARFNANLTWSQEYSPFFSEEATQVRVRFVETLRWRVFLPDTAAAQRPQ